MVNTANAHAFSDTTMNVWTAPLGTAYPTTPTSLWTAIAGWQPIGWLSDAGMVLSQAQQETKVYGLQGNGLVRVIRSQQEKRIAFTALEWNAVSEALAFPGSTLASTGFTAEVQTITVTATGGTFAGITVVGYGTLTGVAYNVSTASLATQLTNLVGGTVTVTGTAGTSYVITFPASMGNVALSTLNTTGLTGGSATIATTTPGVTGVNTRSVANYTGQNLRQFGFDAVDGSYHKRFIALNAEAVASGDIALVGTALATIPMTVYCYADSAGFPLYDVNDFPGTGTGLFT